MLLEAHLVCRPVLRHFPHRHVAIEYTLSRRYLEHHATMVWGVLKGPMLLELARYYKRLAFALLVCVCRSLFQLVISKARKFCTCGVNPRGVYALHSTQRGCKPMAYNNCTYPRNSTSRTAAPAAVGASLLKRASSRIGNEGLYGPCAFPWNF
jgi:hypothetical protein